MDALPLRITALEVEGFKSLHKAQRLEIRPLTIIAGANSSGKSSLMQPMLLLKQSLESSYTTVGLLLSGDHLKYTRASQLLSRCGPAASRGFSSTWHFGAGQPSLKYVGQMDAHYFPLTFRYGRRPLFVVDGAGWHQIRPRQGSAEPSGGEAKGFAVFRDTLSQLLHLPGLRGNPERAYPMTANAGIRRGPFPPYTASILLRWQEERDRRFTEIVSWLKRLNLTSSIEARVGEESNKVEVWVSRGTQGAAGRDKVSIADVGVGVSQTLPLLVALLAAEPGAWVYVEQPETHLHPKAQAALAGILAEAADRGVKVIAETHSAILLQEIQTLVAQGSVNPGDVGLHWCQRGPRTGATTVTLADLDEKGSFGDWPTDFGETALEADQRYLQAIARRRARE